MVLLDAVVLAPRFRRPRSSAATVSEWEDVLDPGRWELWRMERIEETDEPRGASVELCLFVAGETGPSARARRELDRLRVGLERGGGRVEVIDVMERPDLAEQAGILATPVLIRLAPLPRRSIIGDLSDWEVVADVLELALERGGRGTANEPGDD